MTVNDARQMAHVRRTAQALLDSGSPDLLIRIPPGGAPTTTFRLDPALLAAAKAKAAERGETLSDVVRRALREYVEEET